MNKKLLVIATLVAVLVLIITDSCFLICFAPATTTELIQGELIAKMISKIDATEIYNTVYALQNLTTRTYGYSGNVDTATYLYNKLSNIPHLSVEYQSNLSNIIATLPGVDKTSNATYIVGAHYDSISSTSYAPGATDDGGGVAIVLEFARIMSQYSFNHTLKFAFWNCEENGQLGSTEYVKYAYNNRINVSLYMNFDSSCYDPYNRMTLELMFNNQSSWVSEKMTEYNTLYGINFTLNYNSHTCSSDQSPFWAYGYTAVMTHSESHGPAHSPDDTIDKVSTAYAQKNGKLGMSLLAALAEVQDPTPTPTYVPTPTSTTTPTLTPAVTPTSTPTATLTVTPSPTSIPAPVPTATPGITYTPTPTATSRPTVLVTPTPRATPISLATIVTATTDNGATVALSINGNLSSSQMSNTVIVTNQSASTTTLTFIVTGDSGTTGFGNVTIPKSAISYGTTTTIYIDGEPAQTQGYTQDAYNYYVWYATRFSAHEVSIVFAPELTPYSTQSPSWSQSLPLEAIYEAAFVVVIVAFVAVVFVSRKSKKG